MSDVGASFTRGPFNPIWRQLCSGEDRIALGSILATEQLGAISLPQNGSHRVAISSRSSRRRSREAMNCACISLNASCRSSARVVSCPKRRRVSMTSRCLPRHASDRATRSSASARSLGMSGFILILLLVGNTLSRPVAAPRTVNPVWRQLCSLGSGKFRPPARGYSRSESEAGRKPLRESCGGLSTWLLKFGNQRRADGSSLMLQWVTQLACIVATS